jgi:sugar O-acyltransferase (sialic acid O-acetyltransferase NeuD family)
VRRLLIVGAGGAGREVAEILVAAGESPAGFLDRNPNALAGKNCALPVLGDPQEWKPHEDELFVCSMGDAKVRMTVTADLRGRGGRFTSAIDCSARVAVSARLGSGVVVYPSVFISSDAVVDDDVMVNFGALIAHDAVIERGVVISPHVTVCGSVRVGAGAFIGAGACIVPGISVGAEAYVCAGAVVIRDVDPGSKVWGVPAHPRGNL